jgi:hypothetical protein
MTIKANYIGLGPIGLIGELPSRGRTFSVGYEGSGVREERAASGLLRTDKLYTKLFFNLSFDKIYSADLEWLQYCYEYVGTLNLLVMQSVLATYDVSIDPFDSTRFLMVGNDLWSGVDITLRQR